MYATAQRVRDVRGREAIHAFLHYHDMPSCPYPEQPLDVPQAAPGRLALKWTPEPPRPGGNEVLAYVDVFGRDGHWSTEYAASLRCLAELVEQRRLPFVARVHTFYVVFNGQEALHTRAVFEELLDRALAILAEGERRALWRRVG